MYDCDLYLTALNLIDIFRVSPKLIELVYFNLRFYFHFVSIFCALISFSFQNERRHVSVQPGQFNLRSLQMATHRSSLPRPLIGFAPTFLGWPTEGL